MEPYWVDVALIAVLMLVNGAFAGSEITLISLREGQLRALERRATGATAPSSGSRATLTASSAPSSSASHWPVTSRPPPRR